MLRVHLYSIALQEHQFWEQFGRQSCPIRAQHDPPPSPWPSPSPGVSSPSPFSSSPSPSPAKTDSSPDSSPSPDSSTTSLVMLLLCYYNLLWYWRYVVLMVGVWLLKESQFRYTTQSCHIISDRQRQLERRLLLDRQCLLLHWHQCHFLCCDGCKFCQQPMLQLE